MKAYSLQTIEIRLAALDDIQEMVDIKIDKLHVGEPVHPLDGMMQELFLREFKKRWEIRLKQGVDTLLITADRQIVGFVSYSAYEDPARSLLRAAEISHLYILPDIRRKRLGSRLCRAALVKIREGGFDNVVVWVPSCSRPSIRFYEQLDFKPMACERIERIRDQIELREICYQLELKST
ncbi:hypothetical protein AQUSIP_10120 [Aquicella siphonis]|uniref:N-acetyltransferase domain-containing protein n=1 Tax=Aquicella siphonis TaxID=254247 RepID=A0A5E4PGX4_9COXI|nr:GNAT family N-acetyltransferase [Aquicella siphonis]VVC75722.1 hypothetical protein AQUSIP_10120 [Aquicella siphonis]